MNEKRGLSLGTWVDDWVPRGRSWGGGWLCVRRKALGCPWAQFLGPPWAVGCGQWDTLGQNPTRPRTEPLTRKPASGCGHDYAAPPAPLAPMLLCFDATIAAASRVPCTWP